MTNSAAIGYMILAAKRLEIDFQTIKQLQFEMYEQMDEHTEKEAEDAYYKN